MHRAEPTPALDEVDFGLDLRPHPWPGRLIAFSGIDGSGKSTLIRSVATVLKSQSIVKRYKFPSRALKETALFREFDRDRQQTIESGRADPFALTLVLIGDRLLTVRDSIFRHLRAGHRVIVDRYLYTTLVEFVLSPHTPAERGVVWRAAEMLPRPDCYFVADVPVLVAADRIRSRGQEEADTVDLEAMDARARLFRELARSNGADLVPTDVEPAESMRRIRDRLVAAGVMAPVERFERVGAS